MSAPSHAGRGSIAIACSRSSRRLGAGVLASCCARWKGSPVERKAPRPAAPSALPGGGGNHLRRSGGAPPGSAPPRGGAYRTSRGSGERCPCHYSTREITSKTCTTSVLSVRPPTSVHLRQFPEDRRGDGLSRHRYHRTPSSLPAAGPGTTRVPDALHSTRSRAGLLTPPASWCAGADGVVSWPTATRPPTKRDASLRNLQVNLLEPGVTRARSPSVLHTPARPPQVMSGRARRPANYRDLPRYDARALAGAGVRHLRGSAAVLRRLSSASGRTSGGDVATATARFTRRRAKKEDCIPLSHCGSFSVCRRMV